MTDLLAAKLRHADDSLNRCRAILMQPSITATDMDDAVAHSRKATEKLAYLARRLHGYEEPTTGEESK